MVVRVASQMSGNFVGNSVSGPRVRGQIVVSHLLAAVIKMSAMSWVTSKSLRVDLSKSLQARRPSKSLQASRFVSHHVIA